MQAKSDLESYLAESHPFDEMVEKFNYFQNVTTHITCEIPKVQKTFFKHLNFFLLEKDVICTFCKLKQLTDVGCVY